MTTEQEERAVVALEKLAAAMERRAAAQEENTKATRDTVRGLLAALARINPAFSLVEPGQS